MPDGYTRSAMMAKEQSKTASPKKSRPRRRRTTARLGGMSQSAFAGSAMSAEGQKSGGKHPAKAQVAEKPSEQRGLGAILDGARARANTTESGKPDKGSDTNKGAADS